MVYVMKKYFAFLALLSCCQITNAAEFASPLLAPKDVIEQSEKFLIKEKSITLEKYELASISFNYYSQYDKNSNPWILFYSCKRVNGIHVTDCGFTVRVSNTTKPTFEFIPINV